MESTERAETSMEVTEKERAAFDRWFGEALNRARISAAASPYDTVMKLREALAPAPEEPTN